MYLPLGWHTFRTSRRETIRCTIIQIITFDLTGVETSDFQMRLDAASAEPFGGTSWLSWLTSCWLLVSPITWCTLLERVDICKLDNDKFLYTCVSLVCTANVSMYDRMNKIDYFKIIDPNRVS